MSRSKSVQKLFEMLRLADTLEKAPGFSSILGLSHASITSLSADHLTFEHPELKLLLPLTSNLYLPNQNSVALSTYLAMIDDVTTWALLLSDPRRARSGVSVSLQAEWGPAASKCKPGDVIEISAKALKVGRNMGFARAEVRDAASGDLVCFGSHVKYLPMGAVAEFFLSPYGWPLAQLYADFSSSSTSDEKESDESSLANAFRSFQVFPDDNSASFVSTSAHASLGGNLHGGCQAILMELAATDVANRLFGSAQLESMHVEYHSAPKSRSIELKVEEIQKSNTSLTLRANLMSGGRTASDGVLRFAAKKSSIKDSRL